MNFQLLQNLLSKETVTPSECLRLKFSLDHRVIENTRKTLVVKKLINGKLLATVFLPGNWPCLFLLYAGGHLSHLAAQRAMLLGP